MTAETYYAQQPPIKAAGAAPSGEAVEVSAGVCSHGAFIFDGAGAGHTGVLAPSGGDCRADQGRRQPSGRRGHLPALSMSGLAATGTW